MSGYLELEGKRAGDRRHERRGRGAAVLYHPAPGDDPA